jgi:RNA polymerase sigma-70 factor, ECF subfamily
MHDKSEFELIANSRAGDLDAMGELFRRHYASSIGVARGFLPSQEEFLDAVQSAYLAAFRNFHMFRGEASFKSWITRIVINQCLMRLRQPSRRLSISLDHSTPSGFTAPILDRAPTPEDLVRRAEEGKMVADVTSKLPGLLRDVTRCSLSGLSIQETAQELGLTVEATKTRLFRARSRMRMQLTALRTSAGKQRRAHCAANAGEM